MLFRGKTLREAVEKGLERFGITYETAEVNMVKGVDPDRTGDDIEFIVEVTPIDDLQVDVDGNFKLLYLEDGVYIEVNPPVGRGEGVRVEDIEEKLAYKRVEGIDPEAVKRAAGVKERERIKVAPYQQEVKYPASLEVEISADNSEAYAVMIPPDGGKPLNEDDVVKALNENGVVTGIDSDAIRDMVTKNIYGIPVQVAKSIPPQNGENGYIEYKVDIKKEKGPTVNEDGTVNFYELGLIENVRKGQVLARIVPPTEGKDGQDVRGNVLKAKPGVPARLIKGKNTEVTEDKSTLVATVDGQVSLTNGKLNVYPVYEVRGNVDNSTGNIDFVGKVVVRGNVLTGFEIKAEGDIEVDGVVEGAKLESGGSILLKRGAQGSGRGVLICQGSLVSRFIENCTVEAGGDIIADAVMHCSISSKSSIELKGRKGLLVGGNTAARNEIRAITIGSPMATTTIIEVGVDPDLRKNMDIVAKKLEKEKKSLEQVDLNIGLIAKIAKKGYLPESKKMLLKKCIDIKAQLEENIKQHETLMEDMKEQFNTISKGRVRVQNVVYPGTVITIGPSTYHVKDPVKFATFHRTGGDIKIGSFDE